MLPDTILETLWPKARQVARVLPRSYLRGVDFSPAASEEAVRVRKAKQVFLTG